jgi:hypothetical protein
MTSIDIILMGEFKLFWPLIQESNHIKITKFLKSTAVKHRFGKNISVFEIGISFISILNNEQNDEVCDATDDDSSTVAWFKMQIASFVAMAVSSKNLNLT